MRFRAMLESGMGDTPALIAYLCVGFLRKKLYRAGAESRWRLARQQRSHNSSG